MITAHPIKIDNPFLDMFPQTLKIGGYVPGERKWPVDKFPRTGRLLSICFREQASGMIIKLISSGHIETVVLMTKK